MLRRKGAKTAKLAIDEERALCATAPPGSHFKGCQSFVVQDLVLRPHVIRFRRARWRTPDRRTVTAPLPPQIAGHFRPALRRFVLMIHNH